ncbi:MAG: acyl-CoA dehydrogenase C-terminal domain-containing protein, partial [Frankiales bacterium]|nr:acyl-CoA dehydrogenase C-terminal domain-containing protein [Frankiales bacterium]
ALVGYLTDAAEDVRNIYKVGLNTTRLLLALGDLVVGWLLLRQADVALLKLTEGADARDTSFYEGKVAAAKFFAQSRLPLLGAERVVVEGANLELMDLPESAF